MAKTEITDTVAAYLRSAAAHPLGMTVIHNVDLRTQMFEQSLFVALGYGKVCITDKGRAALAALRPDEAAGQGEAVKEAGAKLVKAMFGVTLNPATPRPEASDAPDIVERARKAADDALWKWRGLGERKQGEGLDGMQVVVKAALDEALAALRAELAANREHIRKQAEDIMTLGALVYDSNAVEWKSRADAAEAEVARLKDEIDALKEALVAHNDLLRGAFGAAQRDAIHEVIGTTNYNLLANAIQKVLFKYHAITNDARSLTAAKGG